MHDNTKWFYHIFIQLFTFIVFLLYKTLMMAIGVTETCC